MPGALADVRVVDFTHALNGPFCTMLLGHLGAEIIKIEPPAGDNFRRSWMAPGSAQDGYEFLAVNTNKKSVVLNLKTAGGIELARRLIATADVLVENYGTGTMQEFGLDYESVRSLNPRLIYACSRGYGESGPYSPYGANASQSMGMSGWTEAAWGYSGARGSKPLGIGDEAAGVSMALGIVSALHARERTGQGQKIDVSMQEAVLGFMVGTMHEHFTGNRVGTPPTAVADGYFTLRAPPLSDAAWQQLVTTIDRDDLAADPRFATARGRQALQREIDDIVTSWAQDKTRQEVWDTLKDIGYFGSMVLSLGEVLEDPHIKAREAFVERDHPTAGQVTLLAPWIHMSDTPSSIRSVAPLVGEHTAEVLGEILELTMGEIDALRAGSVIG